MTGQNDDLPLYASINVKLAAIAAASPTRPSWYEAWSRLDSRSPNTERLTVYRAVRDTGSIPDDAGFFLVAWLLDGMTDERAEDGLRESEERLSKIRQEYGLEDDLAIDSDDVPAEYRDAMRQTHEAWDALYAQTLAEFGEAEMARLFLSDSEQFDRRYEAGRRFFHDAEDDDDWLDALHEAIAGCVEAENAIVNMGLRSWVEDDFWEVWIYPMPVELMGGRHDGAVVVPGFSLDLQLLQDAFDSVAAIGWHALGLNWPEGPHVYVEGVFQGREVYLQVLAEAPADEGPIPG